MLPLKIAWRFLLDKKLQTILVIFGIAIGVSVQTFIGLVSQGLEKTLVNKILAYSPHITIYSKSGGFSDWQKEVDRIRRNFPEVNAVSPDANSQAWIKLGKMTIPILMRGFNITDTAGLYNITASIYQGSSPVNDNEILLGKELAERLGVNVGDEVSILTLGRQTVTIKIVGLYDFGVSNINKAWVITNLTTAQNFIGFGDKVTEIELGIHDPFQADVVSDRIKSALAGDELDVSNWKDENQLIVSAIIGQKIVTLVIQFFIILATIISILNILTINIFQKSKQVGILKAMGITDFSASLVFVFQALLLSLGGIVLSLGFLTVFLRGFNRYIVTAQGSPVVSVTVDYRFIALSILIFFVASMSTAIFPALRCIKLNPIEVIKNA
ncbi:ABC-type transport system, involved in lipoprotein release, permease component [Desulfosporosinus orientis DSM 765]|uniref:ABC-type transport system, involved in lipoprotein release, permease component n=1 Tax=Desulfosporosinus orientis (strain ATCC 19365 / DSM 765 / NCIMB 8382 / VKM B-1628 / Singapore I) TaxID=768706 RepID=G7WJS9_DESOD|nr:ABC transporter permease [Desulfosporosinus orientis]AET70516.1 ABC-type transport system, involved in lipoprotein release, permease component [Desulfosporosinus orientis DSM 765]